MKERSQLLDRFPLHIKSPIGDNIKNEPSEKTQYKRTCIDSPIDGD
jgi:hypothetical protein